MASLKRKTPAPGRRRRGCLYVEPRWEDQVRKMKCCDIREEEDAAALPRVPQGGGGETEDGVGVKPEFLR